MYTFSMPIGPKEKKVAIIYRIPADLHKKVVREAKKQDRSLNNTLTFLLKVALGKTAAQ
jgi:predicted HicB family RNase H-like nuclease